MNILAFLKPKNEVIYLYDDYSVHESLELMEKNRFTTIPIISREGQYVGTLSEGDLLWYIKNTHDFKFDCTKDCVVSAVKRLRDYQAINVNGNMTELIGKAADENFVPVVDDSDLFIGIVTRKTLLNYFFEHKFIVL
jgi:CBS domain-containing protein